MAEVHAQASFNSGEWSPSLFARVDLQKYRSGAALLKNWYVDYRGGVSTRPGSKYVIQAWNSGANVRLIRFQAGFNIGYILEFGDHYIRFIFQGSPVTQTGLTISGATQANPCVLTVTGNTYNNGDVIFVSGVGGMTQLNGRYFSVTVSGASVTLRDLNGVAINSTSYGAYTSGGTSARIYTLTSPFGSADLETIKFSQVANEMVLCHPNYAPQLLTLTSATNWTIAPIIFGSTAPTPTGVQSSTTLPNFTGTYPNVTPGQANYQYVVTSVDSAGQESAPSATTSLGPKADIRTTPGTNSISWNNMNAKFYKIYETNISYFGVQPPGVQFGYIGYSTGTTFIDDNIIPDFTQGVPVPQSPFSGAGVGFITITASGTYTTVPGLTLTGGGFTNAGSAYASLGITTVPTVTAGGTSFSIGDTVNFGNGVVLIVTGASSGVITSWGISNFGSITSGSTPANPVAQVSTSGAGTGATATMTWGVKQGFVSTSGTGYTSAPTVSFTTGAAAATATLSSTGAGNPSVPGFFQQRLVLAGSLNQPQTFYMSIPGSYFNFNIHSPVQPNDAITGTLVSGTVNTIKSIVSVPAGMLILTDQAAFVVNGGSSFQGIAAAVTPADTVATAQSFIGANDMPPIISNFDILFVQSKGAQVRDLSYNIYFNVFTGTDISLLSSHLFYGFTLTEWAWAEQPFYIVWAIRNDGTMLTLTFLKEQEFIGWTHHSTAGSFQSVATVTETTATAGTVDAVYTVVQRSVNGQLVKYIERFADRAFPNGLISAWCVDSGQQYTGASTLSFQGAEHLAGLVVTGLAQDNLGNVSVITPFTMPTSGFFNLPAPASPATGYTTVTIGLGFTCDLQTLPLDIGEPSIQGKIKKQASVDVRVVDTLGLFMGSSFNHLVPMKDLALGFVSSMLTGQDSQIVTGLVAGDAYVYLDPTYTVPGQFCIRQSMPYPASVLGVFPRFAVEGRPGE